MEPQDYPSVIAHSAANFIIQASLQLMEKPCRVHHACHNERCLQLPRPGEVRTWTPAFARVLRRTYLQRESFLVALAGGNDSPFTRRIINVLGFPHDAATVLFGRLPENFSLVLHSDPYCLRVKTIPEGLWKILVDSRAPIIWNYELTSLHVESFPSALDTIEDTIVRDPSTWQLVDRYMAMPESNLSRIQRRQLEDDPVRMLREATYNPFRHLPFEERVRFLRQDPVFHESDYDSDPGDDTPDRLGLEEGRFRNALDLAQDALRRELEEAAAQAPDQEDEEDDQEDEEDVQGEEEEPPVDHEEEQDDGEADDEAEEAAEEPAEESAEEPEEDHQHVPEAEKSKNSADEAGETADPLPAPAAEAQPLPEEPEPAQKHKEKSFFKNIPLTEEEADRILEKVLAPFAEENERATHHDKADESTLHRDTVQEDGRADQENTEEEDDEVQFLKAVQATPGGSRTRRRRNRENEVSSSTMDDRIPHVNKARKRTWGERDGPYSRSSVTEKSD